MLNKVENNCFFVVAMLALKVKSKNALICSVFGYIYTQRFTKRSQSGIVAGAIMEGWK
ncbi:hypothetical protein G0Q29_000285 [Listeria monocytogenes]|nr:hypothetical protein [Listeria monocytogenes]EDP7814651.1 hypothetical protein [Listeria monocytogenes]